MMPIRTRLLLRPCRTLIPIRATLLILPLAESFLQIPSSDVSIVFLPSIGALLPFTHPLRPRVVPSVFVLKPLSSFSRFFIP